jgi:signal transduction histidine kinase
MKSGTMNRLRRLSALLAAPRAEAAHQEQFIVSIQRNMALPIRLLVIGLVFYYYFTSPWIMDVVDTYGVVFQTMQHIFAGYAWAVVIFAALFYVLKRFPAGTVKWFVFALGMADAVFIGSLTVVTGGFESPLYWVYPGIIVLNAISIPREAPQVILNLVLTILFLLAGLAEARYKAEQSTGRESLGLLKRSASPVAVGDLPEVGAASQWLMDTNNPFARTLWARFSGQLRENLSGLATNHSNDAGLQSMLAVELNRISRPSRSVVVPLASVDSQEFSAGIQVLRVAVLTLLTFSFYGVQVLLARQREIFQEQQVFAILTERLRTAGRVAAEFAHQIKNPLAVINTVAFSLQKSTPAATPQVDIIREEITKCDRIITQIMGYGELSEGRIERLDVSHVIESVILDVFPPGTVEGVTVRRDFASRLPPIFMQRRHFTDALANLMTNAREASSGRGVILVSAQPKAEDGVEITVRDEGPGIAPDKLERVFEAYYTTKPKGTGLGLSIVKHNVELYSGKVSVQSKLGNGAEFKLFFPGKTLTD